MTSNFFNIRTSENKFSKSMSYIYDSYNFEYVYDDLIDDSLVKVVITKNDYDNLIMTLGYLMEYKSINHIKASDFYKSLCDKRMIDEFQVEKYKIKAFLEDKYAVDENTKSIFI